MSVFSMIIDGKIPGRFAWADDTCVAFATIEPICDGHLLVVPRKEVARYTDLDSETWMHLADVARIIGQAGEHAYEGSRAMLIVAGLEVPHVHIHVVPAYKEGDLSFANARKASEEELDAAVTRMRGGLVELGYEENVPTDMYSLA